MSRPLPELIDPLRLCSKGRVLQGPLAISRLRRLLGVLGNLEEPGNKSEITVDFTFALDQGGQANISGSIDVVLWILCQRCLNPMRWCQKITVKLALVNSDLEADNLPSHYEPLFLNEGDEDNLHALAEIVESEIILALPQEAMHNQDECSIDGRYRNKDDKQDRASTDTNIKPNPFAILKQIKSKDS